MALAVEKDGFKVGTCKLCGAPIVWAMNETGGGKIPLDAKAPTFAVRPLAVAARRFSKNAAGDTVLVSHFSTCPAKTKGHALLREMATVFRSAGFGVYPLNEKALELMRRVHAHLKMEGP